MDISYKVVDMEGRRVFMFTHKVNWGITIPIAGSSRAGFPAPFTSAQTLSDETKSYMAIAERASHMVVLTTCSQRYMKACNLPRAKAPTSTILRRMQKAMHVTTTSEVLINKREWKSNI